MHLKCQVNHNATTMTITPPTQIVRCTTSIFTTTHEHLFGRLGEAYNVHRHVLIGECAGQFCHTHWSAVRYRFAPRQRLNGIKIVIGVSPAYLLSLRWSWCNFRVSVYSFGKNWGVDNTESSYDWVIKIFANSNFVYSYSWEPIQNRKQ